MNRFRILIFAAAASLSAAAGASAASTFTYQFRLDNAHRPFNGPVAMSFKLFDSETSGNQIGATIDRNMLIKDGLVRTELDFGTQPFDGGLWLEVSAGGTVLEPRQPVTTLPLAAVALDALNARGAVQTDGNGGFAVEGALNAGAIPAQSPGTRLMWYPGKAAFRAGTVSGSQWDDSQIGRYSVAAGLSTTASGEVSVATGGFANASGDYSIAFGRATTASGESAIAMGRNTTASGLGSIAMGRNTFAVGQNSVAMGFETRAEGWGSVAMGWNARAQGDYSLAMGCGTRAFAQNMTAIGHYNVPFGQLNSTAPDRPLFVVGNGTSDSNRGFALRLLHNGNLTIAGAFTANSNRNDKHGIVPVDPQRVLQSLDQLDVSTWRYMDDPDVLHIGPMAQDFHAAFHVGEDDTSLSPGDTAGAALAAIQALYRLVNARKKRIEALETEIAAEHAQLIAMQEAHRARLEALEATFMISPRVASGNN